MVMMIIAYFGFIFFISMTFAGRLKVRLLPQGPQMTYLDFQAVLKENDKFDSYPDKCPLRIRGGIDAGKNSVPYQVALRRELEPFRIFAVFCGGAIITKSHVLTARSCFISVHLVDVIVVAGAHVPDVLLSGTLPQRLTTLKKLQAEESWSTIKTCHGHFEFDGELMINDFAVLELKTPFVFSSTVQPIKIMSHKVQRAVDVTIPENTLCLVAGFGLTEAKRNNKLQMVCLPVVSLDVCKKIYPGLRHSNVTQLCGGNDAAYTCPVHFHLIMKAFEADSGGPLVCKGFLVGLVSYGGKPGKIARVYTFLRGYTDDQNKVQFYTCSTIKFYCNFFVVTLLLALTQIFYFYQS